MFSIILTAITIQESTVTNQSEKNLFMIMQTRNISFHEKHVKQMFHAEKTNENVLTEMFNQIFSSDIRQKKGHQIWAFFIFLVSNSTHFITLSRKQEQKKILDTSKITFKIQSASSVSTTQVSKCLSSALEPKLLRDQVPTCLKYLSVQVYFESPNAQVPWVPKCPMPFECPSASSSEVPKWLECTSALKALST